VRGEAAVLSAVGGRLPAGQHRDELSTAVRGFRWCPRRALSAPRRRVRTPSGGPPGGRGDLSPETQIQCLKPQNAELKDRVTDPDATIEEPTDFKKLALFRFAAQYDEIMRLRSPQSSPEPPAPAQPATVPCASTTVIGTRC
jgi:hypothetical protein